MLLRELNVKSVKSFISISHFRNPVTNLRIRPYIKTMKQGIRVVSLALVIKNKYGELRNVA